MSSPVLPDDPHNRELLRQVRPADWQNPQPAPRYDLVVIGAGTAGLVSAAGAAGLGARVALVEKNLLGGDCLNFGCVPSKALIRSSRVAGLLRKAERFGIRNSGSPDVDFPVVMRRMRELRSQISVHDSAARFRELDVDVFLGTGQFHDRETLTVSDTKLRFKRAVICTGGRPRIPQIPGLDQCDFLTNESVFSLELLPRRMAVIGGGPIGCELAQVFARFGSQVTLFQSSAQLLPRDESDAAQLIMQSLQADGVQIHLSAHITRAESDGRTRFLEVESNDGCHRHEFDAILVAAGRVPELDSLRLERAGVSFSGEGIIVDDHLRTTNWRIYAAGDVCSREKFTHVADSLARTVLRNAFFGGRARASQLVIPHCTYTSPEVAQVGITAKEASRRSFPIQTFTQELSSVDRAVLDGTTNGFMRIHVHAGTDRIAGATIVAEHAGELIAPIVLAMTHGLGLKKIASTIFPYPTQSEALRKIADQYQRTRLTSIVRTVLRNLIRLRR